MKRIFILKPALLLLLTILTSFTLHLSSEHENDTDGPGFPESCTSIMVGRLATVDGSVITSHSCDGNYRTWLEIVPGQKHTKNSTLPILWGTLHTETPGDMRKVIKKGEIPQVEETYAYLSVAYPSLNEKQLAMGETTITGRKELRNEEGLFLIEELQKIALQRCSTAREAIRLMGSLAEKYGYGDWAECLTIADKKEVWHFEICGSGPGKPGAMWVAQRIPDDHVGVSANISRIAEVDFNNPDEFLYSTNLKKVAKKTGFWDGTEPFKFYKVISGRKPFAIRDYYVLSTLAPSLHLTFDAEELPFSVKPDQKVSVRDIMKLYRETYEGTEWDMTKNLLVTVKKKDDDGNEIEEVIKSPVVNNWMSNDLRNLLNEIKPGLVERQRAIAIAGCSYSQIIQCRDWLPDEIGGVAWFSFDNPGQSPRIPIFSGTTKLPESFKICGQHSYRNDAALWSFREANRLSTINWTKGRELIEPAVMHFEEKAIYDQPELEKKVIEFLESGQTEEAKNLVTSYTNDFAAMTMKRWEEMKSQLWWMFGRGF
jgi:dipeptidase